MDARSGPVSPPFQLVPQAPAFLHGPGSAPAPRRPPRAAPPRLSPPTHAGPGLRPGATRRQQHPESPGPLGHPRGGDGGGDRCPGSARAQLLTCLGAQRRLGERARGAERKSWPRLARPPREAAPGGAPWRRDRVPACAGRVHTWARAGSQTGAHALTRPTGASRVSLLSPCWTPIHLGTHTHSHA